MKDTPTPVFTDDRGRILDLPGWQAAGRSGREIEPLDQSTLIPLPRGSLLFRLPKRDAVGFDSGGTLRRLRGLDATAAFLPPGYAVFSLAAYRRRVRPGALPLYAYCAVCWQRGRFRVPAQRVDRDPRHDPDRFDPVEMRRLVRSWVKRHPENRLIRHHGLTCALSYRCPNAQNLFLQRWEAPVAVSASCNARCRGCISGQPAGSVPSCQERIGFRPTVKEIVELAVPHLQQAPRAMISFGQGCEGEPLLRGRLIAEAIREIRRQTRRGTIHLNTNGSLPEMAALLFEAGLDSIRISLNSAREPLYHAYFRCRGYRFSDVAETIRRAVAAGRFTAINYLSFPGVTDDRRELDSFSRLLESSGAQMIQWRNLNIDPDCYMNAVDRALGPGSLRPLGMPVLFAELRRRFPQIRFGYFNPPVRGKRSTG